MWLIAASLALLALTGPGYASTASGGGAASSAGAARGEAHTASNPHQGADKARGKHRSCTAKKKHRTAVVSAKHGKAAGKAAGRKAFRRCKKAKRAKQSAAAAAAAGVITDRTLTTNACLMSVPDPGTTAPVKICYSLFQPKGSGTGNRVPMIMQSHGFGGSRTTDPAAFQRFLDAGYGVLSFDQRGFGESGGQAYVENPDVEGYDVRSLIDRISGLNWVAMDSPGDPRMAAIGGSYGGGYQFLGAFESLRLRGVPIFDALAPEITWYDLEESLAPSGVVRTAWALALSAGAAPSDALPTSVKTALAEGVATGNFPPSLRPFFEKNGPKYHVANGRALDIPVLFGQGITDTLFPLEQGLQNFQKALTPAARAKSIFVGYNGGHVLPAVYPRGVDVTSDPCSQQLGGGTFADLTLRFFDEQLKGRSTGLGGYGSYHLATPTSTCLNVTSVAANTEKPIGTIATTTAAGAATSTLVAQGPITLAGTPYLTGAVTALGVNNRGFLGLAMGTSPADAKLIQNNVLPINEPAPVVQVQKQVALPSVAVDLPAGQNLYLLASPTDTIFTAMGSRSPGLVTIDNTVVHLPVVAR